MFERSNGPSLADFWREISYNNIPNITTDVYGWYTLPHDRAYYGFSETIPGYDAAGIVNDCATGADADVNFNNYDAVAIMLNSPVPVAVTTAFGAFPDGTTPYDDEGTMWKPGETYHSRRVCSLATSRLYASADGTRSFCLLLLESHQLMSPIGFTFQSF